MKSVLVFCGLSIAGVSQAFTFADFSSVSGLTMNGAAQVGNQLRVIDASQINASVFYSQMVPVLNNFTTTFSFNSGPNGDGWAFLIQNSPGGANSLGDGGGYLGYKGLSHVLAVEFDTVANTGEGAMPRIDVVTNGTGVVDPLDQSQMIATAGPFNYTNGVAHTATVNHNAGVLTVLLDGVTVINVNYNLANLGLNSSTNAFIGFSGGNFNARDSHFINSWTTEPVPEPATLAVLGIGALMLRRRR